MPVRILDKIKPIKLKTKITGDTNWCSGKSGRTIARTPGQKLIRTNSGDKIASLQSFGFCILLSISVIPFRWTFDVQCSMLDVHYILFCNYIFLCVLTAFIPASNAFALTSVSFHSACGSESATIPPPVWMYALPAFIIMVLITIFKHALPAKSVKTSELPFQFLERFFIGMFKFKNFDRFCAKITIPVSFGNKIRRAED